MSGQNKVDSRHRRLLTATPSALSVDKSLVPAAGSTSLERIDSFGRGG